MSENKFKSSLARGEPQIGLWLAMASPYTAQMLAGAGFDWLLIDGEHAPNTLPSILAQLQAVASYPAHAVVRSGWNDTVEIKRLLDIGVRNLLVPMVQDAEEAASAVAATRYPPLGVRGVGAALARASEWNRTPGYLASAADGICVLVQAETRRALSNLDDICRVDGVDGVFIGPADLAADMGHLGNPGHLDVQRAIEEGIPRIRSHGKAAGILTSDEKAAQRYIELGATFTAVGADTTLLIRSAEALAARFGRRAPHADENVGPGRGSVY